MIALYLCVAIIGVGGISKQHALSVRELPESVLVAACCRTENKGRDFAKEFMDQSGFKLVDYGFLYRFDQKFKHDDMTWFLLEK